LYGQAVFLDGEPETARRAGLNALKIARHNRVSWLSYSSHLLLGRVEQAQSRTLPAIRRYGAAARTIERLQHSLTITLRSGFLENKQEALHNLIALYLDSGQAALALETLERAKSQAHLNHLMNRQHLRWLRSDTRSQALIDELERLRVDHHGYYQLAFNPSLRQGQPPNKTQQEQACRDLERCEKRMRAITEQLYLQNGSDQLSAIQPPRIDEIKQHLSDDSLLLEFYSDSRHLWAFIVDSKQVSVKQLPLTPQDLNQAIQQFQFDISCALKLCAHKGPFSAEAAHLTPITRKRLESLYAGLLSPLADSLRGKQRLMVVPYGALHYLPFHLLHDGERYLIDRYEMVFLPTSGMLTVSTPRRLPGALILAHPWNGRLPQALNEAEMVQGILKGESFCDGAARREHLLAQPRQVLHIAAHGEYRMDEPNLSYVELADGQLYTDDLLQHDLSYELVTLSACETGRAKVVPGDELIGLGRGFLYAGAGALITSLWRIDDHITVQIMQHLYRALQAGASKASALRDAQRAFLQDSPQLHPAFWGAFQLIGNAEPLSTRIKETES
jgi:CHAT domain-containing protein